MMKPTATTCIATSLGIPNRLQASGISSSEPPATPDAPQAQIDPAALQGMVTASAAQAGLSVERLDNEGEGAVQVALQPAPFAKLLPWLEQLNGQGVQVAEAGLDRQVDGRVSARLSLRVE